MTIITSIINNNKSTIDNNNNNNNNNNNSNNILESYTISVLVQIFPNTLQSQVTLESLHRQLRCVNSSVDDATPRSAILRTDPRKWVCGQPGLHRETLSWKILKNVSQCEHRINMVAPVLGGLGRRASAQHIDKRRIHWLCVKMSYRTRYFYALTEEKIFYERTTRG